jgi:hypothetical protein
MPNGKGPRQLDSAVSLVGQGEIFFKSRKKLSSRAHPIAGLIGSSSVRFGNRRSTSARHAFGSSSFARDHDEALARGRALGRRRARRFLPSVRPITAAPYEPTLEDDSGAYFAAPTKIIAADTLAAWSLYDGSDDRGRCQGVHSPRWNGKLGRLEKVIATMGEVTAWAHLRGAARRGASPPDVLVEFADDRRWRREVLGYAERYGARVRRDWRDFRRARTAGRRNE